MARISIRDIHKSFADGKGRQTTVLSGLSLDIEDGEFLTVLGPSGCGKSTLIRIIAGLEPQTAGTVEIEGRCVDQLRPAERNVAMVFQSYALYPHMTVAANLALPLTMRRMSSLQRLPWLGRLMPGHGAIDASIGREVQELATALGLSHLLERKPGQLSGGQRQRVALARAMVRHPAAFLMDEPLSNLDANMRAQMRAEIAELHRRLGATFIYVTHDQAEAMTMSSRIVVMLDGRIQQVGPPREIYEDPATLSVASFFGEPSINRFAAQVRPDGAVDCHELVLPVGLGRESHGSVTVAIRPENLVVAGTALHGFSATTIRAEYLGAATMVHARLADGTCVVARATPGVPSPAPDETIKLRPEGELLLFDARGERLRVADETARRQPQRAWR
jgi:multiple sugar transport system ATP-binding protein